MSELVGKTIARVDDYGDEIHFTDGTALRITSDDGHYAEFLNQEAVRALYRRRQGERERARLRKLQREEWLSVSCEERGRRRLEREAKMSPQELHMEAVMRAIVGDCNRGCLLTPSRYQKLCEVCRDPACGNTEIVPAEIVPAEIDFGTMTINIPKVSDKRKARRS